MLAGEPPHTGATARAVIAKILAAPPTRLQIVRGDVPAGVEQAVAKSLRKVPAERFASAAEFAAALVGKGVRDPAHRGPTWTRRRALIALVVGAAVFAAAWGRNAWRGTHRPLLIMMDSPHPSRIYDEETIRESGTNADVISDILADLPIVRQKEAGGPGWHRYDELLGFHPDLIVMHYSTFRGAD